MTRRLHALTVVVLLTALLTLGGCSTGLKLAYDNLERLALWEVDDEMDLDDAQTLAFRTEFRALHQWHRRTQLPLYAADLRRLAAAIDRDAALGEAVTMTVQAAERHGETLWQQAVPGVERLLALIGDQQVTDYDLRQRRHIDKAARKHADDTLDERRKQWLHDWRDSLEFWIGKPNAEQTALLEAAWETEHPLLRSPAERAAVRLASHRRLIVGLATRREPGLIARLIAGADAGEKARSDALRARDRLLIARLFDAADSRQRARLKATVLELAEDAEALAASPVASSASLP